MLDYSVEAKNVKPQFYSAYNDINIFVEDEDDEVFYEKLFQNLLDKSIKVKRVFGVGGKPNLLKKLEEYTSATKAKEKVFL